MSLWYCIHFWFSNFWWWQVIEYSKCTSSFIFDNIRNFSVLSWGQYSYSETLTLKFRNCSFFYVGLTVCKYSSPVIYSNISTPLKGCWAASMHCGRICKDGLVPWCLKIILSCHSSQYYVIAAPDVAIFLLTCAKY